MAKKATITPPSAPSYKVVNRRDDGRNGKLLVSDDVYNHTATSSHGMRLRVTVPADRAGTKRAITRQDWERQLSISRQLYARVGEISGAMWQKSLYAIGDAWAPRFLGKDDGWGNDAEYLLDEWFLSCDCRGEPYDFYTALFLDSIAWDRDGDSLMVTVERDGKPKVQFLPAHRIASRYDWGQDSSGFGRVASGRFKGAKVYNGVIYDNSGHQTIGVNVLGESPELDRQFSLIYSHSDGLNAEAQLLYEPEWQDQGRGIPKLANSLLSWMDYEDINYFLKRQVKQDSAQGIMHYNEEGAAEDTLDFIEGKESGASNEDVKIEHLEGNEIMYFKAMGGGKLEPYKSDRPHPNVDNYTMRILRGCLQSMGWFYEIYDPTKVGGASTRLIQDMARMSVRFRQKMIRKRIMRAIGFRIGWAVERGELPANDDMMKWGFTLPAKLTVDSHYDEKTWSEKLRNGSGTYADKFGESGEWWEDQFRQRIKEQKFLEEECKKEGVSISRIQLLTPNGEGAGGDQKEGEGPNFEQLKIEMDAYGVGVRAGTITPTIEDEDYFRSRTGLPPLSDDARRAWGKEDNVRRPITLTQPGGGRAAPGQPAINPDEEKEE